MPPANPSTNSPIATHELSQNDVLRLLNPEHASDARLDVTSKLANQYDSENMSGEALIIAEQIFRLLVRDTELEIRKKLSNQLKASNQLPRDIALTMANDVVEVALPVLEFSKVLTEKDLVDLVQATPDSQRHVAIAKREEVPERLVEALLESTDEASVAETLASNEGASLTEQSIETLVQRHHRMPQVMDILATRPNLPPTIKEKVITQVSDSLKSVMVDQHDVAKEIVKKEANQSREEVTLELISADMQEEECHKLVEQLITFDRLTPSLLFAAMIRGYINFYVTAMAILSAVPIDNALKLLRDRGGLGFRGIYNKSGLAPEYYTLLRDTTSYAIELKDDMSGLEGEGFAKLLSKRIDESFKSEEKSAAHVLSAIDEKMAS